LAGIYYEGKIMPYKERFTIRKYEYEILPEVSDSVLKDEESYSGDLSQALDAMHSDNWDNVDEQHNSVICYPADSDHNFRTGEITQTHVVVEADRPENMRRLVNLYDKVWPVHPVKPTRWVRLKNWVSTQVFSKPLAENFRKTS
jgi:hypothetical protein